jgi:pimeloyl-ACP methyl ester carboxylesterase
MRKYLLTVLVTLFTLGAVMSQSAMNSGDPVVNFNVNGVLGSASKPNPDVIPFNSLVKWGRQRNTSRVGSGQGWSETESNSFKAYYIKPAGLPALPFRVRFPKNYDSTLAAKYPVILFFHGGGEAGVIWENEDQLFWGAQPFLTHIQNDLFNAFLVFPQSTSDWDVNRINTVKIFIDSLAQYKNADADRVITMGLSDGGSGAVIYTEEYPRNVAALMPSCPVSIDRTVAAVTPYKHVPLWMGNGGLDPKPTPPEIQEWYGNFAEIGGNAYQSYYPRQGHVMWESQWGEIGNDNNLMMIDFWSKAHKAQPLVYYNNTQFCYGTPVSAKLGLSPGFAEYQWQKNTTGTFVDIPAPAGTASEYTATEVGQYRVRFRRVAAGAWSAWTPVPVSITYKSCSADTLFKEDFETDKVYLNQGMATNYKNYNWTCQNSLFLTGADNHTTDATGILGRRFSFNYTYNCGGYTNTDNVWGMSGNQVTVVPGLRYLFSFSVANQSTSSLAQLTPRVNGVDLIAGSVGPSGGGGNNFTTWRRHNFIWTNPNGQSFADLAIKNKNDDPDAGGSGFIGNDFLLDEITFTRLLAPGGVYGSALWVKGESVQGADGQAIANWSNNAGGINLQQTNSSAVPNLKYSATEAINFNPVAKFAAARNIGVQGGANFAGTTSHTRGHIFMVGKLDSHTQTDDIIQERESDANRLRVNLDAPSGADQMGKISFRLGSVANVIQATNVTRAGVPTLFTLSKDNANTASGNKMDIRKNGVVVASNNLTSSYDLNNGTFTLGGYAGSVAEVIYFIDSNITPLRQNTIESYLAIKYGLTLGTPASPSNYLASDSATNFWPGLANIAYTQFQNDVFGIGTDIVSGLRSFRSNSLNSGSGDGTGQAGKGNIILSVNAALADKRFLMIGNDAATLSEQVITVGTAPALIENGGRVGREWKVKNTGSVGAVNISFDTTGFTYTGGNVLSNFKLMIDGDGNGNFANGTVTFFNASSATGNRINFDGVTLTDGVVFTVVVKVPAGSLPATWLGFTAEESNGNALLNWKTSEEINVASYAVEHSTTGSNFKEIGKVSAKNTTAVNNYNYTDPSLSAGVHYYRIRRVDLDGKFNYSVVKTIKVSAVSAIQIRPNPVTGSNLVLAISLQRNEKATIQVVGVDGKVLSRRNTELVQGANTVTLDMSNVPTGVYLVQVQLNDEVASKKFIKVR